MIRAITLFTIIFLFGFQINAQIVITSDDMPVPGDTVRKSNTAILDSINYQQGGPDQTWLFDELTVVSQQVDTFVNVSETPAIYQIFFNNQFIYPDYKSTVALKMAQFTAIPTVELTDSYLFIKVTDEDMREVGYGVTLEGVPLPIQFQQIDTIYRFPLEYGDVDSAHSLLSIDVPDLGYLMISKFRKNTVDGWGTLTTPYGEFQTLRVKTEIVEYDSLYSDSLGMGMPLIRNIIEYKWLANGFPEPVLQVTEEGFIITASYIDSIRSGFLNVPEVKNRMYDFSVYPNPSKDYLSVSYELFEDADVKLSVYSIYGTEMKRFAQTRQERGLYNRVLYLKENGFRPGVYLIRLTIDNVPYVKRILLN
ncbi:MAG: T9SS type A sorting domain-containing protein [Bacteroidales bacterium]|nr:T9SS type A sorting domain-containing protein [Bacteroidales bacterium]